MAITQNYLISAAIDHANQQADTMSLEGDRRQAYLAGAAASAMTVCGILRDERHKGAASVFGLDEPFTSWAMPR